MNSNVYVWIILIAVALAALYLKGYISLGFLAPRKPATPPPAPAAHTEPLPLDSRALGLLMAQAARGEAELEIAARVADDARARLVEGFQAPFAASFGMDQPKAGAAPTPATSGPA
jgi:hypothetical protein